MKMRMKLVGWCCIVLNLMLADCVLAQSEQPAVTPYRPSVSSPAQLPFPGQLEFETGFMRSQDDGVRRQSLPYQWKLALNSDWGILLGGEAQIWSHSDAQTIVRGGGDTSVVLKRALVLSEEEAFGWELGTKFATAKKSLGSGKQDVSLNTIYSRDLGKVHVDVNANLTHLGAANAGDAHLQKGLSTSFSMPISGRWAMNAEWSGIHQRGEGVHTQVLFAAVYSPHRRLSIDVGLIQGLNNNVHAKSFFSGVVLPVAQLF